MIAGEQLAGWLADRSRQLETRARMTGLAERWSAHPLMTDLHRALDALPEKSAAAILPLAESFLERDIDIEALVSEMIDASSGDPFFRPPFLSVISDIHAGLLLFRDPNLSIALGVTSLDALTEKKLGERGPTSIGFTGLVTLFKFVRSGGATLSFWEAPEIKAGFGREESGSCRLVGHRKIEDGEVVLMDGRRESFVIEHATSDVVYLQAVVRSESAPLGVEYDSSSLTFAGASSTDEASSRIQMMVTFLRMTERTDALPLITQFLDSPHFYTRWHLMRELLAMDAEVALPHLKAMAADDPHPEVREAAAQTLAAFFPEETGDKIPCPA